MKKKVVSLLLVAAMCFSMTACGSKKTSDTSKKDDGASYDEVSATVYDAALGDFEEAYSAVDSAKTVSERYALQAVAEAKLMESAVMLPLKSFGGRYLISRVAPYSTDYALWGNDSYRYHQALVTTDLITTEDKTEMKQKWAELKGTGTYEEWAKSFLAEKGYTLKDDYTILFTSAPATWDVLSTSLSADSEAIINTYDGLYEYDAEGTLQPALAESMDVSDDGLTYTFKIKQGIEWVDSQGNKVADVKADDFVAGMQHMMDAQGGLEYLVDGVIDGASEYIAGKETDFSKVGVKAVDDYTLEYTLTAPCTYFDTMLGYGIFAPMSRDYYESQGGKFGQDYDPSAEDYTYGTTPDKIAYCGPYLVTSASDKQIVFKANKSYWNANGINIHTITWLYDGGDDVTRPYNDTIKGTIDGCNLTTATLTTAKEDGNFDKYAYVSDTDATSFMAFFNLNRQTFANTNDDTTVVSEQSEEDKERTNAAMQNVHFRRALSFAVDRGSYNAQQVGDDLKYNALRNMYTPGTFVQLAEDTTIAINGKDTTFKAGTNYGEIVQAQIDADGVKMTVYDPKANDGLGSSDGFDGWYSVENAQAELEEAIKELEKDGVKVDAKNPIVVDYPYASNDETYTNTANALKQSVEKALDGKVQINLVKCASYDENYYAGYYCSYGKEMNYDIYDVSGWSPDYGDPKTYLDTFLPDYSGYMVKCLGIF